VFVDLVLDDTIIEVHGHAKEGSGYGYSGARGLNALLATLTIRHVAPVIVTQRLRKGTCGSPRGAKRAVRRVDCGSTVAHGVPDRAKVLVRMDSAFYGGDPVRAAVGAGG
jgi:hypothetical protein